jgi:hydrophobe/amphiphile efflux-3 (HAE3) family protein
MIENLNGSPNFFKRLAVFILKFRWPLVVLLLLLTAFSFYKMRELKFDSSIESMFLEEDPQLITFNKFKETFGSDDFVYILFETEDFFKPEMIRLVSKLAEDLETNVPYVDDVKFLGNVEYVEGVEGGIEISDLIEKIPEADEEIKRIKERAMAEPLYIDNLISKDGKTAAIAMTFELYPEEQKKKADVRHQVGEKVLEILAKPEYENMELYTAGGPVYDCEYDKLSGKESSTFGLICLSLNLLILLWVARGVRGVIAPLLVVVLSIFWTLGLVGIIGWTLNMMVILLPVLLICVGIGDSMHIIAETQDRMDHGHDRKEAIVKAFTMVGVPCFLTSLTTAAGFTSFLGTVVKPVREMGVYAAIGVIMAFVVSLIIVPIIFSLGKDKKRPATGKESISRHDLFDRILDKVFRINTRYPKVIIGIFIGLTLFSVYGYLKIEVETNSMKGLSADLPLRQAYDYIDSKMGGSMAIEMMLDTGRKDGVKDITFLKELEQLQNHIDKHPLTMKTTCVIDFVKKMNRAMHENSPSYYSLPKTSAQATEQLFLYETSGGKELDKQVSFNYDIARLTVRTQSLGSKEVRTFMTDIDKFVKENLDSSIKVEYTGIMTWLRAFVDMVANGQKRSFVLAFSAIAIMMIIALRSFKLGLISMAPNLFPVLISMGFMGMAGMYIDATLMIFSAIIIGVVVDDTIHFFSRYKREFKHKGTYKEAFKATLSIVGRPIMFTTIILVAGFSVFGLSDINSMVKFGLMAGFAFIWALLADFFLAPALLLLMKPLGAENGSDG